MSEPYLITIFVAKEVTNEAEPWTPPSVEAVADFIRERCQGKETDDGYEIVGVGPQRLGRDRDRE